MLSESLALVHMQRTKPVSRAGNHSHSAPITEKEKEKERKGFLRCLNDERGIIAGVLNNFVHR